MGARGPWHHCHRVQTRESGKWKTRTNPCGSSPKIRVHPWLSTASPRGGLHPSPPAPLPFQGRGVPCAAGAVISVQSPSYSERISFVSIRGSKNTTPFVSIRGSKTPLHSCQFVVQNSGAQGAVCDFHCSSNTQNPPLDHGIAAARDGLGRLQSPTPPSGLLASTVSARPDQPSLLDVDRCAPITNLPDRLTTTAFPD